MKGLTRIKVFFGKCANGFYRFPILITLTGAFLLALIVGIVGYCRTIGEAYPQHLSAGVLLLMLLGLPFLLTLENVIFLVLKPADRRRDVAAKKIEATTLLLGVLLSWQYFLLLPIRFADWQEQLYGADLHTPIATDALPTIVVMMLVAVAGYLYLRYVPLRQQPPLTTVFAIAALYLGMVECVLWCVQFGKSDYDLLWLLPLNFIIIAARTVRQVVWQKAEIDRKQMRHAEPRKLRRLSHLLDRAANWPWLALILALPLLGAMIAILALFGQEPDSVIKAWAETADWTLSQKIAPQNIQQDQHYLCTVAAGGHRKVVKPLRTGKRHGHRVVVNRQLCIANAFEQLLEERAPRFHRLVRGLYDKTGYPIAKHIRSPYLADAIYVIMKPLEWAFLSVLYLCDAKPENRIAVQYPHSTPPVSR